MFDNQRSAIEYALASKPRGLEIGDEVRYADRAFEVFALQQWALAKGTQDVGLVWVGFCAGCGNGWYQLTETRVSQLADLCERCSPLLAPLARDKGALLALYRRQAAGGCASGACKNPACRLADGGDAGALEALLAHLCSITPYFVCVADHARLAVPPLPPQLARPRRASAGSGEAQGAPLAASSSAAARRSKRSVASAFF
jgi:hypothetical protein